MESSGSSLQSSSKGLSNGVLFSSLAASVSNLRMPKVACWLGHNVIGKKQASPHIGCYSIQQENA